MDKILEKVKKLLALANDAGASEGERDNALRMAHNMLAKHNLSMVDLNEHSAMEGRETHVLEGFNKKWCRQIGKSIAELFFCEYYFGEDINGTKCPHYFVGKQSNAVTASLMTEYLIASILKECRKNWKHNLAPESRAFAYGAADRIFSRVCEMRKNPEVEGEGNALVVINLYKTEREANRAFMDKSGVSLVKIKSKAQPVNSRAYNKGFEYADGLSLNGQLVNRNQKRLS